MQQHDVPLSPTGFNCWLRQLADDGRANRPFGAPNAVRYTPSRPTPRQVFSAVFRRILEKPRGAADDYRRTVARRVSPEYRPTLPWRRAAAADIFRKYLTSEIPLAPGETVDEMIAAGVEAA